MMLMPNSVLMRLSRYQTMWSSSMPMNSAIASSADRFDSATTVASDWLRQRPNVSGATPAPSPPRRSRSSPTKYDALYSANSLTAFALNYGVYFVPFAMVPSSPIELAEMRNKNQVISVLCGRRVPFRIAYMPIGVTPYFVFDKTVRAFKVSTSI